MTSFLYQHLNQQKQGSRIFDIVSLLGNSLHFTPQGDSGAVLDAHNNGVKTRLKEQNTLGPGSSPRGALASWGRDIDQKSTGKREHPAKTRAKEGHEGGRLAVIKGEIH